MANETLPQPPSPTSAPGSNVVYHQTEESVRPDWVPSHAIWVNGQWYVNGVAAFKAGLDPSQTRDFQGEGRQAGLVAAANVLLAKSREGLPRGYYRFNGLVYAPNGRVAKELPGGYVVDGSDEPGWAEARAARIAGIKEAAAAEHQAIAELEAAQKRRDEAAADRFKSHNVMVD